MLICYKFSSALRRFCAGDLLIWLKKLTLSGVLRVALSLVSALATFAAITTITIT